MRSSLKDHFLFVSELPKSISDGLPVGCPAGQRVKQVPNLLPSHINLPQCYLLFVGDCPLHPQVSSAEGEKN